MMQKENFQLLFCVKCKGMLDLEILNEASEITEGFLTCKKCHLKFPIISKIPIMLENLPQFLENRSSLGGFLLKSSLTKNMKQFIKQIMSQIKKSNTDFFETEKRWTKIYLSNKNSPFFGWLLCLINPLEIVSFEYSVITCPNVSKSFIDELFKSFEYFSNS